MYLLTNGQDAFNTDASFMYLTSVLPSGTSTYINARSCELADMNKDGYVDLYLGLENQQNRLFFNDGKAKFVEKTFSHLSAIADNTRDVSLLDVDLDGDMDIFVTNGNGSRLHLGELNFKLGDVTASNLPTGMNFDSQGSAAVDFDGDGLPDIFTVNWAQQNTLLSNIGAGFFADVTDNLPRDADYSRGLVYGDFDGDGDLDVFVVGTSADRIYLNETPK